MPRSSRLLLPVTDDVALVELALRLRADWFRSWEAALDQALPGAVEAVGASVAYVDDDGSLRVAVPPVYPVLPPVHRLVRDVVRATAPDGVTCSVRFPRGTPRRPVGPLDVHRPGDPDARDWPDLLCPLRSAMNGVPALTGAEVVGVSYESVWLRFPDVQARRAVGVEPGAAYALHQALEGRRAYLFP